MTEIPRESQTSIDGHDDSTWITDEESFFSPPLIKQPPVLLREIVALVVLVLACDLTLYRSFGFAGPGVLFLIAPLMLGIGTVQRRWGTSVWVMLLLLILLSLRLLWCGSWSAVVAGFVLIGGFSMSLAGFCPYLTRGLIFTSQLIAAGYRRSNHYFRVLAQFSPVILRTNLLAIILPIITLITFASIFVLANPDLVKSFGQNLTHLVEWLEEAMRHVEVAEILFCFAAAGIIAGLLRPDPLTSESRPRPNFKRGPIKSLFYEAYRNTLIVVIGLFSIYLAFEFQTLWFRTFPPGFHYSGYAHEGAAWLTVALGLATLMLSLIFRGSILNDPRLPRLRLLSSVWSLLNLLLVLAVFNRLFIYIGFNGMTRMRVVGLLGVASVFGGFLLVLRKIGRQHDFTWLIRHQLWTVAFAGYLYVVLPVDAFVNQYNVNRILAGDPRPSVQIAAHPPSDEGWLCLKPLMNCTDPVIQAGVRGMLDLKRESLENLLLKDQQQGWTTRQIATDRLVSQLRASKAIWTSEPWSNERGGPSRQSVIDQFQRYSYQWY